MNLHSNMFVCIGPNFSEIMTMIYLQPSERTENVLKKYYQRDSIFHVTKMWEKITKDTKENILSQIPQNKGFFTLSAWSGKKTKSGSSFTLTTYWYTLKNSLHYYWGLRYAINIPYWPRDSDPFDSLPPDFMGKHWSLDNQWTSVKKSVLLHSTCN